MIKMYSILEKNQQLQIFLEVFKVIKKLKEEFLEKHNDFIY